MLSRKETILSKSPWENAIYAAESLEAMDKRFLPGTNQEVEFIIKELDLAIGSSILDIGCGAGRHAIELTKFGYSVTGIDISRKMLAEARSRAQEQNIELQLIEGDVLNLPKFFNGQTEVFNGAICICESGLGSLGGWQKDLSVLKVIHSLLINGSKLILTTFNGLRKYRGERIKASAFDFIQGSVHWQLPDDWHGGEKLEEIERVYIPSEIAMLFEIAGFSNVEILGSKAGNFLRNELEPDDIEMMIICKKIDG